MESDSPHYSEVDWMESYMVRYYYYDWLIDDGQILDGNDAEWIYDYARSTAKGDLINCDKYGNLNTYGDHDLTCLKDARGGWFIVVFDPDNRQVIRLKIDARGVKTWTFIDDFAAIMIKRNH